MRAAATLEARAGDDGQARILGKAWIGFTQFAEKKLRAFAGGDFLGVDAIGAQAKIANRFIVRHHTQFLKVRDAVLAREL